MKNNCAVIGLGLVGKTICYSLMKEELFDTIFLLDINENLIEAESNDLSDGAILSTLSKIKKGNYNDLSSCEFIIIAAGIAQSSVKSRLEQTDDALKIFDSILDNLKRVNYDKFIIICSNPVDILTFYTIKKLNYDYHKVIGSGTLLDTNRYKNILSNVLNISPKAINGYVVGEHGSGAVTLFSSTLINNISLDKYLLINNLTINKDRVEEEMKKRGFDIVKGKGATFYGVSECVIYIIKNINFNTNKILPLSILSPSKDFAYSYLVNINKNGIEISKENDLLSDKNEKEKLENAKNNLIKLIKDKKI